MDKIDEINKGIKDLVKENAEAMYTLTEIHSKDLQQLFEFIIDDMEKTYDDLITQRNDCIDKYIKVISIILQDEKDISKPIQSMVEKKHADANKLKKEIAPLIEFKELMLRDSDPTDEDVEKMMEKIKNI